MALDPQTLSTLSPGQFVALVKGMSDQEIRDDLAGPNRRAILDAVFARFPQHFRPEKAGDRSARIDFRVSGGPGDSSDSYGVVVENGTCRIEEGAADSADLSLVLGPVELLKVITGTGNPAMMFMMGKIKASGDLGMAAGLANWFETPAS